MAGGSKEFADRIRRARSNDGNLYIPSLGRPYGGLLQNMTIDSQRTAFEIVHLDDQRYIYRLLTEADLERMEQEKKAARSSR